jgi:hypothetical protein
MASETIYLSKSKTSGSYIEGKIEWQATADTAANASKDVVAKLYVRKGSTGGALTVPTEGTWNYSLAVNGSDKSGSIHLSVLNDWVLVATNTISSIAHNHDGTKKVAISGSVTAPSGTSFAGHTTSGSTTVDFDTIPRASAITSAAGVTLGNKCSVKWTPASASFRYKLRFSIGNWSYTTGAIHPNKTTEYTYSEYVIPLDAANNIPGKTGTMTVTLYTYSNSSATTQAGAESSTTFTVTVPDTDETRPIVKSMSVSPVSTLSAPYNGMYIQGHSSVKATLSFETKYNASVAATSITVEGITYESPYESAILNHSGKVSVKATVKDSRGHYGTNYREIEVIPYSKPYVHAMSGESNIIAGRCDASGKLTDSGTYLKIKAKAVCSKIIANGVQHNYCKLKYRYRKEGGTYSAWQTILDVKADKSDDVITAPLLNGTLDIKTNYQVQLIVTDDFDESVPVTISVPSDDVYMDRPAGGKSMGLGGYSTGAGILDIYWKTKARGGLSVFDATGNEIPLDSTMPIPRDQIKGTWDPNSLDCGIYVVTDSSPLKSGDTVIMYNGVLIQMKGTVGDHVKFQLTLPVDGNRSPMYRVNWYSNWSDWRSLKL